MRSSLWSIASSRWATVANPSRTSVRILPECGLFRDGLELHVFVMMGCCNFGHGRVA
jgi:hypothetical protein